MYVRPHVVSLQSSYAGFYIIRGATFAVSVDEAAGYFLN